MVHMCVLRCVGLLLIGMLAACASHGGAWREHERGLPPDVGDPAALWQALTADANANKRNGHEPGKERTLDASAGQQPIVHMRVDDGWLVGVDNGEWVGALWWVSPGGTEHRWLATANVLALVANNDEAVAVTGLAHREGREGALVHLDPKDHWRVVRTTTLPSTPSTVAIASPLGLLLTFDSAGVWCSYRDGELSPLGRDLAWNLRGEPAP